MVAPRSRLARGAATLLWGSAFPLVPGLGPALLPTLAHAQSQSLPLPPAAAVAESRQSQPIAMSIQTELSATDNGGLAARGQERGDLILSIRPALTLARRSDSFEFELDAAANLLGYANGTQPASVLPDARASLKSTVIDHWLYFNARAQVQQSEVDPFGARAEQGSAVNRRTEGNYRLSPYVEREFLPNTTFLARHDLGLKTNAAGETTRQLSNETLLRVERKPVPLGAAVELSHFTGGSSGVSGYRFTLDTGRVRGTLAATQNVVLGVTAGQDRSKFLLSDYTDTLYGMSLEWHPGPRTDLSLELEHRFFGPSGAFTFRHRMPSMSFSVSASRQPVMASSSLGVLGQGGDVRNFLDSILTTRYPDPTTRAGVVDNLVTSRGLDTRAAQGIDLVANYPQLMTKAQVTWAWLSARNAASLVFYSQTTKQLTRDGDPFSSTLASAIDNRQIGGSLQFNRNLTPQLSANAMARWSRINGLETSGGDLSDEKVLRVSVQQNVSPRTAFSAGIQHTRFMTTVVGKRSYDATLAFVGMSHRF